MRAEPHVVLMRTHGGLAHRMLVAGVAAAGDVRAVDERPDFVFAGRAFAEVGAHVDHNSAPFVSGSSQMRIAPIAKSRATTEIETPRPYFVAAATTPYVLAAAAKRPGLSAKPI